MAYKAQWEIPKPLESEQKLNLFGIALTATIRKSRSCVACIWNEMVEEGEGFIYKLF